MIIDPSTADKISHSRQAPSKLRKPEEENGNRKRKTITGWSLPAGLFLGFQWRAFCALWSVFRTADWMTQVRICWLQGKRVQNAEVYCFILCRNKGRIPSGELLWRRSIVWLTVTTHVTSVYVGRGLRGVKWNEPGRRNLDVKSAKLLLLFFDLLQTKKRALTFQSSRTWCRKTQQTIKQSLTQCLIG